MPFTQRIGRKEIVSSVSIVDKSFHVYVHFAAVYYACLWQITWIYEHSSFGKDDYMYVRITYDLHLSNATNNKLIKMKVHIFRLFSANRAAHTIFSAILLNKIGHTVLFDVGSRSGDVSDLFGWMTANNNGRLCDAMSYQLLVVLIRFSRLEMKKEIFQWDEHSLSIERLGYCDHTFAIYLKSNNYPLRVHWRIKSTR